MTTSPNIYTIISVIGYFIIKERKCYYVISRLYRIINKYTNENIAGDFIDLFYNNNILV